ncbi:hypothetical protein [Synechococcus phage S-N03]|uniref:Uncharacterized protein n=1 Tax=Synechococcus phage S-N03 TaxID=2718943 RepID=A0A6G8R5K1_9CAUD|nr:hypothetical protein PQC09_gp029 [Synechococcus phage S-N03]QIN96664.1 hypothetical protein [Synechococcus phage S-N03]
MNYQLPYQVQCSDREFIILARSHKQAYDKLTRKHPEYTNTSMLIRPMFN